MRNHNIIEEQTGKLFKNSNVLAKHVGLKGAASISASFKRRGFYFDRKTHYTYVYAENFTGLKKIFTGVINRRWNDITDNEGNHYTSLCKITKLYPISKKEANLMTIQAMKCFENGNSFVGPDGKIFTANSHNVPNTDREPLGVQLPKGFQYTSFTDKTVRDHLIVQEDMQKMKQEIKERIVKNVRANHKPIISPEVKAILQKLLNDDKIETMIDVLETFVEKEENEN